MADILLERTSPTVLMHVSTPLTPDLQNASKKKSGELLCPEVGEVSVVSAPSFEPSRFNHAITVLFSKIWCDIDVFKKSYFDVQSLSSLMNVNRSTVHEGTQMLQSGYPYVLRLLLNRPDTNYHPDKIFYFRGYRGSVLEHAILCGDVNIVRELIRANAEVNSIGRFNNMPELFNGCYLTPFLLAVSKGHVEIALMLQRAGADIMREDDVHVGSALSIAFKMLWQKDGFGSMVEVLLQMPGFKAKGAGSVKTKALVNAIEFAGGRRVKKEYADALRLLIRSGADFRTARHLGYTTLMRAVINGNQDIVHILLEALKSGLSSSSQNPQLVRDFLEIRHPENNKTAFEIAEILWESTIRLDWPQHEANPHEHIYEMLLEAHIIVGARML